MAAMNHSKATRQIGVARGVYPWTGHPIDFISPVLSVTLAAESINNQRVRNFTFSADAAAYAESNGLTDAIAGQYRHPTRSGRCGYSYSQLARLQTALDVDFCNAIISDLLYSQLGKHRAAGKLAKIVGELHDNVASHAGGLGFCAAQVYQEKAAEKRIEYAIADIGCGILYNASRADASILRDVQAIEWALRKGTTSARRRDDWAQRLPDDSICSPYPAGTDTFTDENHHLGLGLYELRETVAQLNGQVWIWSGRGTVWCGDGRSSGNESNQNWQGVVIEFEVRVAEAETTTPASGAIDALRKRLRI